MVRQDMAQNMLIKPMIFQQGALENIEKHYVETAFST